MRQLLVKTGLIAGMALTLTACNPSGPPGASVRHHAQDTIDASNPRARLVLGSQDLVGRIALTDARIGAAGDLTRAEVTVQNLSNDRYSLEYQYAWEDRDGFSIGENRVWNRFVLAPRELRSFKSVASSPKAHAFTFTVRLPEDFFINQQKYLKEQ